MIRKVFKVVCLTCGEDWVMIVELPTSAGAIQKLASTNHGHDEILILDVATG